MKKIFLGCVAAVTVSAAAYFVSITFTKSDPMADLLMANVEALANPEGGAYGLLWQKEWVDCYIKEQIIVSYRGNSMYVAGTYQYSVFAETHLSSSTASYTVTSGKGEKSYCRDGWSLCSKDECRLKNWKQSCAG